MGSPCDFCLEEGWYSIDVRVWLCSEWGCHWEQVPLPKIDDLFGQLCGACVFSKIDLRSGQNELKIEECDLLKTVFISRNGLYVCTMMSFGLTNAPAYFMYLMNKVFMEYLDKCVVVFISDSLVYSRSEEEHKEHLRLALQMLWEHRLYANLSKCEFWMKQVAFLGHVIPKGGISVDPSKVEDVLSWKAPMSVSDIWSFLELARYYQRFIEGFLKISKPMTELLEKDKKFEWMLSCEASFQESKKRLTTALILVMHDMVKSFSIYCDASVSYPVLRPKPSTHSMCVQESSLHRYHSENGYRITNVTIYNIFTKQCIYKRLSQTLSEALQQKDTITPQAIDQG
jgi:hypothetical protein